MNILLEGCDRAGKSSVADALLKMDDYKVIHLKAPIDYDGGRRMYVAMLDELWAHDNIIYDRAHLSEAVYAPLFRGYYPRYMAALEQLMPDNVLLVHVYADLASIKRRFDNQFIAESQIPDVLKAFRWEFNQSIIKHKYELDTTNISALEGAWRIHYMAHGQVMPEDTDELY